MGFILAPKLYTKVGERTEKLYLLFGKHRDIKAAVAIARVQSWSVTGTTRPVSTKLGCMKVVSSGFIGVAMLLKFLRLQRSDSWGPVFFPTMRAEGTCKGVISQHFRCTRVIPSHITQDYSQK